MNRAAETPTSIALPPATEPGRPLQPARGASVQSSLALRRGPVSTTPFPAQAFPSQPYPAQPSTGVGNPVLVSTTTATGSNTGQRLPRGPRRSTGEPRRSVWVRRTSCCGRRLLILRVRSARSPRRCLCCRSWFWGWSSNEAGSCVSTLARRSSSGLLRAFHDLPTPRNRRMGERVEAGRSSQPEHVPAARSIWLVGRVLRSLLQFSRPW